MLLTVHSSRLVSSVSVNAESAVESTVLHGASCRAFLVSVKVLYVTRALNLEGQFPVRLAALEVIRSRLEDICSFYFLLVRTLMPMSVLHTSHVGFRNTLLHMTTQPPDTVTG